jgi:threonyl-tRNA synthetase
MGNVIKLQPSDVGSGSIAELAAKQGLGDGLAAKAGGRLLDLSAPVPDAERLEVLTFDDDEGREAYRHTASHVMAQAVKRLHPEARLAIGPAIEEGFYYDFDCPAAFAAEELQRIEAEMTSIIAADLPVKRLTMSRREAIAFFEERGEPYKVELLNDIPDEAVSCYQQGEFTDLCRGPHLPSTGLIKAFKLLSTAGAYWRGDERRPMLQRIYGTAFPTEEQLQEYLRQREEALRRDHRRLGKELDLFSLPEAVGGGLVLWHPKGALVRYLIEEFWRKEHLKRGYQLVFSPHIAHRRLWEISGHLDFYAEGMYGPMMIEDEEYRIKPMNCPFHMLIYKSRPRSYRDLPIRYCELGTVYRYERSGVLHGLLRVRGFTQDDAHIICTPEQVGDEVKGALDFALFMMRAFGYRDLQIDLSTRSEEERDKYMGSGEDWALAERCLAEALESRGVEYRHAPGEAVFYGPKIDIKLKDVPAKLGQGPTIQFDFNIPSRFALEYAGADGQPHTPVMIHRALLGSMERFMGALIEHYGGAFPLWLAPVQVVVLPIAERHHAYAQQVVERLQAAGMRAHADTRSETVSYRIREAEMEKVPYLLVVGDREQKNNTVAVRKRGHGDQGAVHLDQFMDEVGATGPSKRDPEVPMHRD